MSEPMALYFGCWDNRLGHHFYLPNGRDAGGYNTVRDWLGFGPVDGKLNPSSVQGEAAIHWVNGWTALAWADRSVDTRGGSNSVVFLRGRFPFAEAVEQARRWFPHVFERQPVDLWDTADPTPTSTPPGGSDA